jgi:cell division protein ZapA
VAESSTVRVVIFDQVYHVRASDQAKAAEIERLAGYVDGRMRAIAAQTRDVDSLRLAVLAALHIADEYHALQERYDVLRSAILEKSAEFGRLLDSEIRKSLS